MANIFSQIAVRKPEQSTFNLNHDVKLSFDMGQLIPVNVQECLPGDRFRLSFANMVRLAPMLSPVMHRIRMRTDYFFVANRLLWPGWEDWITDQSDNPAPYVVVGPGAGILNWPSNSVADYIGFPTDIHAANVNYSPLVLAAYRLIYDEYYRDQNLQGETFEALIAGDNSTTYGPLSSGISILNRAWQHDYFTSALPFAQKGDAVQIPLVFGSVPVELDTDSQQEWVHADGTAANTGSLAEILGHTKDPVSGEDIWLDPNGSYTVDVQAQATDLNSLRTATALQKWLELNARGGTRYNELMRSHFNQRSSDARLQRPELIGSHMQNVTVSEIVSTAQDVQGEPTDIPVGEMRGHGISVGGGHQMYYNCEEHGWIIGIVSIMPDTAYQQGVERKYTRFDRLDYAWPSFANLGEQEIKMKELYVGAADPEATFGYTPRYAEYKYGISRVAGEFRSNLSFWHMGRIFDSEPTLSSAFITSNPTTRIFAVEGGDAAKLYAHVYNMVSVNRKLPYFGIPTL